MGLHYHKQDKYERDNGKIKVNHSFEISQLSVLTLTFKYTVNTIF